MKKIAVIILISVLGVGVAVAQDSLKVLCIGNSFTYVHDTHLKLKEIANSQGHPTSVRASSAGGMSFWRHLISDKTMKAFAKEDLSKKQAKVAIRELQEKVVPLEQQIEFLKKTAAIRASKRSTP